MTRRQREMVEAIEWAAVDRDNGFRHLRANAYGGNANGLFPVWNGVEINARAKALLLALALSACGDNLTGPTPPDAGLELGLDATADSSTLDAYDPFGDPPTDLCSDVCPGEILTPWYSPANVYVWSYCRPSYLRCIDPTAPVCQGCP